MKLTKEDIDDIKEAALEGYMEPYKWFFNVFLPRLIIVIMFMAGFMAGVVWCLWSLRS